LMTQPSLVNHTHDQRESARDAYKQVSRFQDENQQEYVMNKYKQNCTILSQRWQCFSEPLHFPAFAFVSIKENLRISKSRLVQNCAQKHRKK
jgi:hypothetical protein